MKTTPMKAIRAKCMDCSNGSHKEIRLCPITDCPLYVYRSGHNPALVGRKGNPEALRKYREMQKV